MYEKLKQKVCSANLKLPEHNLVTFSWGNVSEIDRSKDAVAIKPSGLPYEQLTKEKIVVVDLDGKVLKGDLKPSSDTPTHLELYRQFESIGGICHTHSLYATIWAQACREIPCFGTTHADYFRGSIPVTEKMTDEQIKEDYEANTGKVIVRRFAGIDPMEIPAVLVANHGPFTWGGSAEQAVHNAIVLELVAQMALGTISINPRQKKIWRRLLDQHFLREHEKNAY